MATRKYISLSNLTSFLNNLKSLFATKTELNTKSDKTHTHAISDVSNLQSTLNGKANSSHGTHVTYSSTSPLIDGTASVGSASTVARSDHRHPTDTSRAAQTSLDSHTGNTTSHMTSTERTNWNTAYSHSQTAHAPSNAEKNQNAFSNVVVGSTTIAADTATDTITLVAGSNIALTPDATNDKITISAKDTTYSLSSFGITATASELNKLDGVTATAAEINYVDGVTSNIQTQLDNKVPTSRTINGKALSSNITLSASDVGASASNHTHSYLPLSGGNLTGVLGIGNKYELSPAYNYTNGCLIDICAAKSSTMVAIHITGNSYNSSTSPIDSLFQFYDYGDGTIMNYSGINLGLSLGTMTAYRYNNRLYAYIKQTASYQTLSFTIITNKSGLTPTVTNTAAHTSGYTDLVTITPKNVALDGHTHNYAGSSSAGGAANSAIKATQDASGNVITSTYATKTELNTAKESLQSSINGKANSSHTHTIANITNLQTTLDAKASSSHTHNYAGSSSVGGSATSAAKLDTTTAGDTNTPVYFSGGKPVACTSLDLNTSGSSASCTGNSATATKLQTARTIALGTGATGTATSFNGTGNITIPVTDVKESYLSWGGKNLVGSVSPIGAALSTEHSANRLAYLNPAAIKVEYSNDAGSTWTDSGLGDSAKINFVTTSNGISVGSNSTVTANHRTRVTLTAQNGTTGYVYTRPRKMLINVSTAGHGLTVTIEAKTGVSNASWTTLGTYELNGWSGWNDIPMSISTFGGGTNQTGNYWYMRLTFANTSVSSSYTTTKSSIIGLRLFGDTCWTRTSNMGETGHLYSYDSSQNATFPANVTATTLSGTTFSGSGVATLAEVKSYLGI